MGASGARSGDPQRRGARRLSSTTPIEQYDGYMRRWLRRKESTVTRYLAALRFLEQTSGKPFLTDLSIRLDQHDVMGAVVANGDRYSPETYSIVVKAAKSWEKTGEALGWWTANGILKLSYSVPRTDPEPPLTPDQIRELWKACRTAREWRLVALGLFAGTNVGDAERIESRNWLDDRIRYVRRKTGKRVEVPLHPRLEALKDVILNDTPSENALKMTARRLAERTSFWFTPNALRRTFAQTLLDKGVAASTVEELLGHTQRKVLFTSYATVPWEQLTRAIDVLGYEF